VRHGEAKVLHPYFASCSVTDFGDAPICAETEANDVDTFAFPWSLKNLVLVGTLKDEHGGQ